MIPAEMLAPDALLIAAMLATGARGILSHQTAAHRWGIIPAPHQIHLATRMELIPPRRRGAAAHGSASWRRLPATGDSARRRWRGHCSTSRPATRSDPARRGSQPRRSSSTGVRPDDVLARCVADTRKRAAQARARRHVPGYGRTRAGSSGSSGPAGRPRRRPPASQPAHRTVGRRLRVAGPEASSSNWTADSTSGPARRPLTPSATSGFVPAGTSCGDTHGGR